MAQGRAPVNSCNRNYFYLLLSRRKVPFSFEYYFQFCLPNVFGSSCYKYYKDLLSVIFRSNRFLHVFGECGFVLLKYFFDHLV